MNNKKIFTWSSEPAAVIPDCLARSKPLALLKMPK